MKKWCIVTQKEYDEFIVPCNSQEEALRAAEQEWSILTDNDKKHTKSYFVGLLNLDESDNQASDESGNIDITVYEVAKQWK